MFFKSTVHWRSESNTGPDRRVVWFGLVILYGMGNCTKNEDRGDEISSTALDADEDTEWPGELDEGESGNNAATSGVIGACELSCSTWEDLCPVGYKCSPTACIPGVAIWDSQFCRPVEGTRIRGESCFVDPVFGRDDCARGLLCWASDSQGQGQCVEICTGRPDRAICSNTNEICMIANDDSLPLCRPLCDPLALDCPDRSQLCIHLGNLDTFVCVPDASGTMGRHGDPCRCANCCNPGHACVSEGRVDSTACDRMACCAKLCSVSQSSELQVCSSELESCEPVFLHSPMEHADVGWCVIKNSK